MCREAILLSNKTSWKGLQTRIAVIYLLASSAGVLTAVMTCLLIGRFSEYELKMTTPIVLVLMLAAGIGQYWFDNRSLRFTRQFLTGSEDGETRKNAYAELIGYPWRGSLFGFATWQICTLVYCGARFFIFPESPIYRHAFIFTIVFGAAFLNWTAQYFLLRRSTYRVLERLDVDREVAREVSRRSLGRKYMQAFVSLLLGVFLVSAMIGYGLNRNLALSNFYRNVRDVLVASEILLYEYDFGQGFDVQSKVADLNRYLPGVLEIVPSPDPDSLDVTSLDDVQARWFIFPVYTEEVQKISANMSFVRPLSFGDNRNSNTFLQYTTSTESLQEDLDKAAIKLTYFNPCLDQYFGPSNSCHPPCPASDRRYL